MLEKQSTFEDFGQIAGLTSVIFGIEFQIHTPPKKQVRHVGRSETGPFMAGNR